MTFNVNLLLNVLEALIKVTLLGFDPSLTKATTNEADSNIKHANSKNDADPKNQNIALKKTLNIYSLNINGLLSDIDSKFSKVKSDIISDTSTPKYL